MTGKLHLLFAAAAGLLLVVRPASAQQGTGTVTGTITDAELHRPVAEAQVVVVGTTIGARTDASGVYRITGVPAGAATVRASRIGYQSVTRPVDVTAGGTARADFALTAAKTILSTVTVTASGTEQRRRENGASVATVSADSLPKAAVQNFSELITARTPGVTVEQSSGTTGTGARVRIRGANSVSLSNEPLLIIDGVRITNEPNSNLIGVGGQSPSRLNDINPEDIETFDIIKGPAAAALYGTAAANGVIQITTKRGAAGAARWHTFAELGTVTDNNDYPANYGSWYTTPSGKHSPYCNLADAAYGYCTIDSLASYNPIMEGHPFRTGHHQKIGGDVSGGSSTATYFLSAADEKEAGVYRTSNLDRLSLRANVQARPTPKLDVNASSGFTQSNLQLPQNDNNYYGVIAAGITGLPVPGSTQGYYPIPPSQFEQIDTRQKLNRFTGGANATWRPYTWLTGNATLGIDVADRLDAETLQPNTVFFSDDPLGHRASARDEILNTTSNFSLAAQFALTDAWGSQSQIGYQYQREQEQYTYGYGNTLVAGTGSLTGVTANLDVDELNADTKTAGGFVSQQFSYRDKLYLTGTLRADQNSAFGKNFKTEYYPSVSASYVAYEGGDRLSQLRLRGAYGVSGLRPSVLDARAYYTPLTVRLDSSETAGFTIGNLNNPNLRPERTGEFEVGFDASFFNDAASVQATYYDKKSKNALILVPLPPSVGGPTSQYRNIGSVRNNGIELTLDATPLRTDNAILDLTLTASGNRNRLQSLGEQPEIVFGLSGSQRHVVGYPLGGYWGTTIDSVLPRPDGTVSPDSIFEGKERFLGTPLPTRQGSLGADLTLFKNFRIRSTWEYRGGNKLFNATEQFRCAIASCRAINDPNASLIDRANAIEDYETGGSYFGGFVEDGSFVKWRELALTVNAPQRIAARLRAREASITFAGRNLATWTRYTGLDPEVNFAGQSNWTTADFLTQPQVQYFTVRLNLTF